MQSLQRVVAAQAAELGLRAADAPSQAVEQAARRAVFLVHVAVQGELVAPYVAKYFADVRDVWERRTSELAQNVVIGLFPTWSTTITPETLAAADRFLARDDLPAALRRLVSEGRADVIRATRAREADRSAS